MVFRTLFLSLVAFGLALTSIGQVLDDPVEEARAQALMRELRCVAEVRDWFESRYGEFVLFRPKRTGLEGFILWGGPFGLLVIGGLIAFGVARRRKAGADPVVPDEI